MIALEARSDPLPWVHRKNSAGVVCGTRLGKRGPGENHAPSRLALVEKEFVLLWP